MEPLLLLVAVIVAGSVVTAAAKVVPIGHVFIIERLGKHQATLESGLHFILPFIDSIRAKLDVREQPFSKVREPVVTNDNFVVLVDAVVLYQITEPHAAIYDVDDHLRALDRLTITTLRNLIGAMDLAEALTSCAVTGTELRRVLSWTTGTWGIHINRAEITAMSPPIATQGPGSASFTPS